MSDPEKKRKNLDKTLNPYKEKLYFIDASGKRTDSLAIANFLDGTISGADLIGFKKDGKSYLINYIDIEKRERILKKEGKNSRQIDAILVEEFPLKEIPASYSEPYEIRENGLIVTEGNLEPSKSEDKFFVEYRDLGLTPKVNIEVDLKTDKDSTKVTLYPVPGRPGVFRSKDLILVPKKEFDETIKTDQTIVAGIGSEVKVLYQNKEGVSQEASAKVPIKKVLPVQAIILRDNAGKLLATSHQVETQLADAQDSLAQTGIKIKVVGTVIFDVPKEVNLKDGLSTKEQIEIAKATSHLAPAPGIRVIFGGKATGKSESLLRGVSFTPRSAPHLPEIQNTVFLTINPFQKKHVSDSNPGHELGHIIIDALGNEDYKKYSLDETGHSEDPKNLMYRAGMTEREGDGVFREQQHLADDETLLNSSILEDPIINHQPQHREGLRFVPTP